MNQAQKSAVFELKRPSEEYSVLQSICRNYVDENTTMSVAGKWTTFRRVLTKVRLATFDFSTNIFLSFRDFFCKVSQPCEQMLISCQFGGIEQDCTKLFNSVLTDDGLCCIFNGLHKKFMTKLEYKYSKNEIFF